MPFFPLPNTPNDDDRINYLFRYIINITGKIKNSFFEYL